MKKKSNWIGNFPSDFSFFKRIYYHIGCKIADLRLFKFKYSIINKDFLRMRTILRKGDIILLGNLTTAFSSFVNEPLTHSSIYLGRGKIIHSSEEGVKINKLKKLINSYQTIAILRLPRKTIKRKTIIKNTIKYAKEKMGMPYNFDFVKSENRFFCTQLVNNAFLSANYETGLESFERPFKYHSFKEIIHDGVNKLHPIDFLKGNFKVKYTSSNIEIKNMEFILKK